MASQHVLFVGIKGSVLALDRATGTIIWKTPLAGADFVNVAIGGDDIFAATKGELFCLDSSTGEVRWHNRLKGLGLGLVTIAVPGGTPDQVSAIRRKRQRDEAAAAAAASA